MEGDAPGMSATAELARRLESVEHVRRLGQALWMALGSSVRPESLIWAKGLVGEDGDNLLWAALVERGVVTGPEYVANGPELASLLSYLCSETNTSSEAHGQLVWTLPEGVACAGVSSNGYVACARALISSARRTVMLVSPYLEAKGVGLLTTELFEALQRRVEATVLTHRAGEAGSLSSAALEELRRGAERLPGNLTVYSSAFDTVLLHPKLIVADSKDALLGSANITGRALSINFEAGVRLGQRSAEEIERVVKRIIESGLAIRTFSTRSS